MKLAEIETAVAHLSSAELTAFSRWFEEHLATAWDLRFERDVRAGRLDEAGREADAQFEAGLCEPL